MDREAVHIFTDTDLLIDALANREPFATDALLLLNLAAEEKLTLYTSSNSITNIHYVLRKVVGEKQTRVLIDDLCDLIEIIPVTKGMLQRAAKSAFADFEDAVQSLAAESVSSIEIIVTRNVKDYKNSRLKIFTPAQFLKMYA
jgi:predicted nucleic acid-binding protein